MGEEEAVESFAWIAQHQDKNDKSTVILRGTHHLHSNEGHGIRWRRP